MTANDKQHRLSVSSQPKDVAALTSTLEDTQASLAAALARIEAYRCKIKQLTKELNATRQKVQSGVAEDQPPNDGADGAPKASISEEDVSRPTTADGQPTDKTTSRTPPRVPSMKDALRRLSSLKPSASSSSMHRSGSASSLRGQVPTQQPLFFYHADRKVKGFVLAREGCLEFYELVASITPPQLVGVAHIDNPSFKTLPDDVNIPAEQGQQWFNMGWLFHPEDVISNLSHYLTDTLIGSPSAADADENRWEEAVMEEPISDPVNTEGDAATAFGSLPKRPALRTSSASEGLNEADGSGVDPNRWELPVGRKGGHSETWEMLWKQQEGAGKLQRLVFEGSNAACNFINRQVEQWNTLAPQQVSSMKVPEAPATSARKATGDVQTDANAGPSGAGAQQGMDPVPVEGDIDAPLHLVPGPLMPTLSEPSQLLTEAQVRALVTALPNRYRLSSTWQLVYSTQRNGISLQTMYRRAASISPSILVVRDGGGYLYGAYCSEPWHIAPRYYGTGETFVFQLQPHMVAWHWHRRPEVLSNAFFMYACHDSIAVGGGSDFALWLDADLHRGHSGPCDTFGSPPLASEEDHTVGHIELWAPT